MIKFIQDYVTKSLPPETFQRGQEVDRSAESEAYLVRLGVAGYLVDGKLFDADYAEIVPREAVVVVETDRRFGGGRAGEVIGLAAPQRATSGPGNAALFSGQPESEGLSGIEVEQLRSDLGAVQLSFDEHREMSGAEIDRLKGLIDTGNDAFREMNNSHVEDKERLVGERDKALADLGESRAQLETANNRIVELEQQLADAQAINKETLAPPPPDEPFPTGRKAK